MNVLSFFDGHSCGQIALNRLGVAYDNYFACEIDKFAMKVTQANYPETIQLGCVTKVFAKDLPKIDIFWGGSPCQGFSYAGKQLNFQHEKSKLFFEFVRMLSELKEQNPNVKFLLENVEMKKEYEALISRYMGIDPIKIDSKLVSAQSRKRLYWTNIGTINNNLFGIEEPGIKQPKDKKILLKDILELSPDESFYLKVDKKKKKKKNQNKAGCLTGGGNSGGNHSDMDLVIIQKGHGFNKGGEFKEKSPTLTSGSWQHQNHVAELNQKIRRLTPVECERLQTVPDNYTNHVSNTQRYKMLGNGWTVDVICHILSHFKAPT
jgi:site-specific DNA-cytosine methylase